MTRAIFAWSLLFLAATLILGALRADRPWQRLQAEFLAHRGGAAETGWIPWRRLPGWRGFDPSIEVVEVAPPGLARSTPHGPQPRVDRCATCHLEMAGTHLGMSNTTAGAETLSEEPPPFQAHPYPELFVAEGSAHPFSLFGCTVCHGGEGRSTDFSRAGHQPADDSEAMTWAERWRFVPVPSAEPILPPSLVEARCATCHESAFHVDVLARAASSPRTRHGETLEYGRRLARHLGCAGCHAMVASTGIDPGRRRSGPPLGRIAVKTTPEWAYHWIAAPRRFRPTTAMPNLFSGAAVDDPARTARIRALVEVLFTPFGGPGALDPGGLSAPPPGDAERGATLFADIGCQACHLLDEAVRRADVPLERLRGPQLARSGDKLEPAWLFAWLREPRTHGPSVAMPDLRLSFEEAADLTAFLLSQSDPEWRDLSLPPIDRRIRDELVLRHLEAEDASQSAARLARMSEQEKNYYLGRQSLAAFGCRGCHQMSDHQMPEGRHEVPAPALAGAGQDARPFLRRFARGGPVAAVGHSQAPDYGLAESEATALLVALLSWRESPIEPWRDPERDPRAQAIAAGEELIEHHGCLGCHRLGSFEPPLLGGLRAFHDSTQAPPALDSAGARLQSSWIAAFLHDPASQGRRSWLPARMPTYDFAAGELDTLTRFFAAYDDVPLFPPPPPVPARAELAVGRAVASLLRCGRCHADTPEAKALAPALLAPSYRGAGERLRARFVVDWILDPQNLVPGTEMPASFKQGRGNPDSAFLAAMLEAPMFQDERRRLLAAFASDEEMDSFLGDPERVADALRAHLFTLDD